MLILELSNPEQKTFTDGIKKYMRENGITYEALGTWLGVSEQRVSQMLNQKAKIEYRRMIEICQILGIEQLVIFTKEA